MAPHDFQAVALFFAFGGFFFAVGIWAAITVQDAARALGRFSGRAFRRFLKSEG